MAPISELPVFYPHQHTVEDNAADPVRRLKIRLRFNTSVADPDPGSGIGYLFDPWIRDPGWEKVGIRIRDPG
jgi:hypothetical protein